MSEIANQQVLAELLEVVDTPDPQRVDNAPGRKTQEQHDEIIELGDAFDFDGFQVVRREFFAHTFEPAVTFNNYKFYVNSACLAKFPDTEYVQVLINQETKILALRPCKAGERDALAWCGSSKGRRKPKQTTCKLFFMKVTTLMEWNPDYRYKLLGRVIHANGQYLLAFDLTATEVYQRTFPEGAKPKASRTPAYPSGWQNQFGLPFREHRQSMQINIFDGFPLQYTSWNFAALLFFILLPVLSAGRIKKNMLQSVYIP